MTLQSNSISLSSFDKNRQIRSSLVILVPYKCHHVPKYNSWMKDKQLQYLTGSEPLTLEDEFKMLESWNSDPKKCTFIVLDRQVYDSFSNGDIFKREIDSMIGDVNFYINDNDSLAEIEIMIAETWAQNKGRGKEAAKLMMKFGHEIIGIQKFQAKIKSSNIRSIHLFTNTFGFIEVSRSDIFKEITFICDLRQNNNKMKQLFQECSIDYILLNSK